MPIEPETLIRNLAEKMALIPLVWHGEDTVWTQEIKNSLRALFQTEDNITDVLCSQRKYDNHEFLLDVVVWDRAERERVALAVECEWTQHVDAIIEDFWKLLVVKSKTKLMIFALNKKPTKHTEDAVWQRVSDCMMKYADHVKGERYVFINYAPEGVRTAWWVEIPKDGHLEAIPQRQTVSLA